MAPIWVDVIAAVRTLMQATSSDSLEGRQPQESLSTALSTLESHERKPTTYALVAFAAATIRMAASGLDRDESDVLAEVARGVGVDL